MELNPGDGGKVCRTAGSSAVVVSHDRNKTVIRLPSHKFRTLSSQCRATIGKVAGSGITEKPFVKAGTKSYAMAVRNKLYPRTSGVAMNPVDHPFGGKTKPGKHKSVSRNAPPGRKVGSISPRRTGKKKTK